MRLYFLDTHTNTLYCSPTDMPSPPTPPDDMRFCPSGLQAIQYLLDKASRYHPDWLAIRASYGMNGIFMHDKGNNN